MARNRLPRVSVSGLPRVFFGGLRVYYGPEEVVTTEPESSARQMVTVPVSEVLPLLLEARRTKRAWLDDFSDDQMTISSDLYEVLLAYQHFRRPSA